MDSNENRIVVIKSTLEQVKDGIEKVNGNASFILKIFLRYRGSLLGGNSN